MSLPEALVAISGLSVQETFPYTFTGVDQVRPWSVDFVNAVEKPLWRSPFRKAEYTAPVSGTTSIVGSYCAFVPRQTHSGTCAPKVVPPSVELVNEMNGEGQWLVQPGGSTP